MKRRILLLLLAVGVAAAWWIYQRRREAPQVSLVRVSRETLVSSLQTNGKVEPLEWESLRVDTAGLVSNVMVREGDRVHRGSGIAQLGGAGLTSELAAAQARESQARGQLATLEAGGRSSELAEIDASLNTAKNGRDVAERELQTLQRLEQKQAATAAEVEAARNQVRQLEIEIQGLEGRRTALVSKSDVAVGQARLREAEAAVDLARTRIGQTTIRAGIAGIVYNLSVRPGTFLNPGDLVANIGRLDTVRVRVYVDEPELGRVSAGQTVTITWDAVPGRRWEGTVERLPTAVVSLGTRQVGEVLCTIQNRGAELIPGTNVNAEIRARVASNALTVPKEALRRDANGTGLWLLQEDTIVWRRVRAGISSVARTEIIGDLREGDWVALPSETALHSGERVRPVYPPLM